MTLEVIPTPVNTKSLEYCHFVAFLSLLHDMVPFMQIVFKIDTCAYGFQKKCVFLDLKVILSPFKLELLM